MRKKTEGYLYIRGSASLFVMLFGVIGSLLIGGMALYVSMNYQSMVRTNAHEQALGIAEAGIYYYRWHLTHSPLDFTDDTGLPGPYIHEYKDPQGDVLGWYSLEIDPPPNGSTLVTISSTGWTKQYPEIRRTIEVKLGIPSLARYAFLHNSNIFFGSGIMVHGPVLSNGGIRQDGINDSLVQSSLLSYICGTETGCNPSQEKPGVWGYGGPSSLWTYPVTLVDFDSVSLAFPKMRTDAQTGGSYYGPSAYWGYHLVFQDDGTVDVYEVTQTNYYRAYGLDGRCTNLYQVIRRQNFLATHTLEDTDILFLEDTVWVDGIVNGKTTVVAARFPIETNSIDMWINGTIRYLNKDGTSQLGLISQRNIYFVRNLPNNFEINGALLAKNGSVFRHGYHISSCGNNTNRVLSSLTIYGSIISAQTSGWNWGTPPQSGFAQRFITHDNHLIFNPPPYFPYEQSGQYEFISWNETTQ
jgi:hypothetical protein